MKYIITDQRLSGYHKIGFFFKDKVIYHVYEVKDTTGLTCKIYENIEELMREI